MIHLVIDDERIRDAEERDIPRLVELGRNFLLAGPYKDQLADKQEEAAKFARNMILHSSGHVLVAERAGKVIGVLAFIVMPHYFSGERTATEMIWYVSPECRVGGIAMRLMHCAESEALRLGATHMQFTAPTHDVGLLYQKLGYREVEVCYQKELKCQSLAAS